MTTRIGVDLDNTLFANTITETVAGKYGLGLPTKYDLTCYPDNVREECFELFKDDDAMHNLKPYKGVAEKLLSWAGWGTEIYAITARSLHFTDKTREMVCEHYPMITETFLCESFDKRDIISDLNLDVYIDDHYDCVLQSAEVGVPQNVLISNSKTPYNYHGKPVIDRLRGGFVYESIADINMVGSLIIPPMFSEMFNIK